ncbi:MAG: hypothetical protein Kow0032_10610 [Methyloligellaceae bacterium]
MAAPEITRALVKDAASISFSPKARRQSRELAANATIAAAVSSMVRRAVDAECGGTGSPDGNGRLVQASPAEHPDMRQSTFA